MGVGTAGRKGVVLGAVGRHGGGEASTVRTAMTCLHFQKGSPAKVIELLEQLRDLFGKPAVHREDALRQASIRANGQFAEAAQQSSSAEFIKGLRGKVLFDAREDPATKRRLELS